MQLIPLHQLALSETHNVRKTAAANSDELVASIAAHGLLENLLVVHTEGAYQVIAGGRRLAALHTLQRNGQLPADHAVPCEVVPIEQAEELSLAENTVREAMHPADQFDAWARLIDQGQSTGEIAARFGLREELVRQRLKLGRVSPRLLEAYRRDEISLEVLMAYTLTEDHDKQEAVFDRLQDSWEADNAAAIRRALMEHAVPSDDYRVRFVGLEAYEAAGGSVRHDLFEEGCYLEDPELLDRLVSERLQAEAEILKGQWSWVEVRASFPYDEQSRFKRIFPHRLGTPPAELTERISLLSGQIEQFSYDDEESDDLVQLKSQLNELESQFDAYHGFSEEDRAVAGCIVTLGYRGVEVYEGLLRPGQQVRAAHREADSSPALAKPRYSERLRDDLKNYRLHAVRLALASDFQVAFDALVYTLSCRQFGRTSCHWLGTTASEHYYPATLHDDGTLVTLRTSEDGLFKELPREWLNEEDAGKRFAAFCALSLADKQRLLSACVAVTLRPQLSTDVSGHPEFQAIASRLQVDVAAHWRPTEDNFLSRVPKSELLTIGAELWGDSWAHTHRATKKARLVALLHQAFAAPSGDEAARVASWLPEGMACALATD